MNSDELQRWIGSEDPFARWAELCDDTLPWLILTRAEKGAIACRGRETIERGTREVAPIDRTGGGDAFNAGFLSKTVLGADISRALDTGLALAGKVIQFRGTRCDNLDLSSL